MASQKFMETFSDFEVCWLFFQPGCHCDLVAEEMHWSKKLCVYHSSSPHHISCMLIFKRDI